ncbi:MAG: hypothetical protein DHS20C15_24210 [Planctomycetota bacterium]|nr:MAG: hypothetical protein DHS20C15_24210 [Planctomycetota bacterium]
MRLIQRMSRKNLAWGLRRIHSELALLGHEVGESTVHRKVLRHRKAGDGLAWLTFL